MVSINKLLGLNKFDDYVNVDNNLITTYELMNVIQNVQETDDKDQNCLHTEKRKSEKVEKNGIVFGTSMV